jgi:formylglycine-generating enzyme required for sulfatase activity/transcriptional regulator with XRE-family HTH domain
VNSKLYPNDPPDEPLGEYIRRARRRLNVSQGELAESVGLPDDGSLARIERGELAPSEFVLRRIAEELDLPWKRLAELRGAPDTLAGEQPNPYRGLAAFREGDAPLYFGRRHITDLVVSKLSFTPMAAIIGASGSGKTSLVAAGVIPALKQASNIIPIMLRPGSRPFASLAVALYPHLLKTEPTGDSRQDLHDLAQRLQQGQAYIEFERFVQDIRGQSQLLLVVDQFEELFTQCRDAATRRAFVDVLLELAEGHGRGADSPRVLLVFRADFFQHVLRDRPLADALQDNLIHLPPMSRDELRKAITRPAESVGCSFQEGLVDQMVSDAGDEPGRIPLVQYCLSLLWSVRAGRVFTSAAYDALGGLDRAIAGQAERVFLGFGAGGQRAARRLVTRLVRVGEGVGAETRRRLPTTEVARSAAEREVLEALVGARLVCKDFDESLQAETVELAHEAVIGHWARLQEWLVVDRQFLLWQQRLERTVKEWKGSDEQDEFLLRGRLLAEGETWAELRLDDMSEELRDFLAASIRVRDLEAAARAREKLNFLLTAEPSEVPRIVMDLREHHQWVRESLLHMLDSTEERRLWRVHLALAEVDPTQVEPLSANLLSCAPEDFAAIMTGLRPHRERLVPIWESALRQPDTGPFVSLRAASALSICMPQSSALQHASPAISEALARENPLHLLSWAEPLSQIQHLLIPHLRRLMTDSGTPTTLRDSCALLLLHFIKRDTGLLADVTTEASAETFPILLAELQTKRDGRDSIRATLEKITSTSISDQASDDERCRHGQKRAIAGILMLLLGMDEPASILSVGTEDPEAATQFVHQVRVRGLPAARIAEMLVEATTTWPRYWLTLAMGSYETQDLSDSLKQRVIEELTDWYLHDNSAAVHSATSWLLRSWQAHTHIEPHRARTDQRGGPEPASKEWFSLSGSAKTLNFVRIPKGTYLVGCHPEERGAKPYETPVHEVTISHDYALCISEVTRGDYEDFVDDTKHLALPNIDDWSPTRDHPVVGLTWFEAEEYAAWLNGKMGLLSFGANPGRKIGPLRLPTEAEWEIACRAGASTAFSFGSDRDLLPFYGWFQQNSNLQTHSGHSLRPNRLGLFNMHGNTWEWCSDWYGPYPTEPSIDPKGLAHSDWRVLRGGCWNLNERYSRSACRNWHIPTNRNWYIGLRLAMTVYE